MGLLSKCVSYTEPSPCQAIAKFKLGTHCIRVHLNRWACLTFSLVPHQTLLGVAQRTEWFGKNCLMWPYTLIPDYFIFTVKTCQWLKGKYMFVPFVFSFVKQNKQQVLFLTRPAGRKYYFKHCWKELPIYDVHCAIVPLPKSFWNIFMLKIIVKCHILLDVTRNFGSWTTMVILKNYLMFYLY